MITMTNIAEIHGPRLLVESVVPAFGAAWKQRPSLAPAMIVTAVIFTDNSTGVSAAERRHR